VEIAQVHERHLYADLSHAQALTKAGPAHRGQPHRSPALLRPRRPEARGPTRQLAAWGLNATGLDFSAEALRQATAAGVATLTYAHPDRRKCQCWHLPSGA
jgi:hypothetical protein